MRVAVIGATGDVGRGITAALLDRGHQVIGVARNTSRLEALRQDCGTRRTLETLAGSVANDADAAQLAAELRDRLGRPDAIVVTVTAPRQPRSLLELRSNDYAALIWQDLISHFTAARAFVPLLAPDGMLLGIGGGSCDFVLQGGIPQSNAQAALRMLYRGLAEECRGRIRVRELIIASVVNGASNRHAAHPSWVTEHEIGAQVAAMLEQPEQFANPIWRIARRDASGQPVVSDEGPSRVQGFDAAEATPLP